MFRIVVVVNWIRFFLSNHATIEDIALARQADLDQLALGQGNQIFIFRIPEAVVFKTKVFEPVAGFVRIGHHFRGPGPEVLNPANLHTRIVNVDPIIMKSVAVFQDQHHGQEVAVFERIGGALCFFGNGGLETID
jgi:hypothetical protein